LYPEPVYINKKAGAASCRVQIKKKAAGSRFYYFSQLHSGNNGVIML
jgi:hypothetical protein